MVAGAVAMLHFSRGKSRTNAVISSRSFTYIGRLSYSLYMWHWPIYCFVDFVGYDEPGRFRTALKILCSIPIAVVSYHFMERPLRGFLNRTPRQKIGMAVLAGGCAAIVACGIIVRKTQYLSDPKLCDVAAGGVVLNGGLDKCSAVLMGDSIGSMYTCGMRDMSRTSQNQRTDLERAFSVTRARQGTLDCIDEIHSTGKARGDHFFSGMAGPLS